MYTYELWPVDNGFGYTILDSGTPWIVQPHDPAHPGFVSMTKERAEECALQILEQLTTPQES